MAQQYSNVAPDLVIYFDEGSSLIESDDATISRWIGLVRGVGLALLISNQSAVSISQRCLSNFPNRFIAQLSSHADLNSLAASCGLNGDQKQFLAQKLKPGLLAGSLSQGDWRHPFLFTTPLLKSDNCLSPTLGCQQLDALPVVPAPEFLDWVPEWMRREVIPMEPELSERMADDSQGDNLQIRKPADEPLPQDERKLLLAIAADPCQPVSYYPSKARMSNRKALRARKSLIAKQLVEEQSTQLSSGRGRPSILLAVTSEGICA